MAGLLEAYNPYEVLFVFLLVYCYYLSVLDTVLGASGLKR